MVERQSDMPATLGCRENTLTIFPGHLTVLAMQDGVPSAVRRPPCHPPSIRSSDNTTEREHVRWLSSSGVAEHRKSITRALAGFPSSMAQCGKVHDKPSECS